MFLIRLEGVGYGVNHLKDDAGNETGAVELGFQDHQSGIAVVIPLDQRTVRDITDRLQDPKKGPSARLIVPDLQVNGTQPNRQQRRHPGGLA
jgi:hypothetical protein